LVTASATATATLAEPRPLAKADRWDEFDSGEVSLDRWLIDHAWAAHAGHTARVFCAIRDERIAGYYALAAGSVARESAGGRLTQGAPDPIPVIILARLAVDRAYQGQGLGADLLVNAMIRTMAAAESIGARALVVHAIDTAASFYRRYGFEPLADEEHHLFLLLKDIAGVLS
jgi:GNAT superfamily N-acetyltransferase